MAPSAAMLILSNNCCGTTESATPQTHTASSGLFQLYLPAAPALAPDLGGGGSGIRTFLDVGIFKRLRTESQTKPSNPNNSSNSNMNQSPDSPAAGKSGTTTTTMELHKKFQEAVELSCWSS